jgi:hypothetical protein
MSEPGIFSILFYFLNTVPLSHRGYPTLDFCFVKGLFTRTMKIAPVVWHNATQVRINPNRVAWCRMYVHTTQRDMKIMFCVNRFLVKNICIWHPKSSSGLRAHS